MQAPFHITDAPAQLAPSLGGSGLLGQLAVMAAYLKELELQSHLIHLNYTGSNFLSVHEFLKGQYELHLEQFDAIAEFVRAMGAFLPAGNSDFRMASRGFTEAANGDPQEQLQVYVDNLRQLKAMAVQLEAAAGEERAIDVQNYAAELAAAANKAAWFLSATLA
jgi:DNA-binding ferritin-like protein